MTSETTRAHGYFSKSSNSCIKHKAELYEANLELLKDDNHFRSLYSSQVARTF